MSNTVSEYIYGSPVDLDEAPLELVDRLKKVIDNYNHDWKKPKVPCWHSPYDQSEEYLWFGLVLEESSNGYSSVPVPPDETVIQQVQRAFDALPEKYRSILPAPAFLVLTRID